ncbi:MAG: murein L,D-transpeptidase catalytic domain family protein [Acidobacteriota bacterium]
MKFISSRSSFSPYLKSLLTVLFLLLSVSATGSVANPSTKAATPWEVEALSPNVLRLALEAAQTATKQGIANGRILGIIDFSLPSTKRRFWVLDTQAKRVLFYELVAHGKGSGENFATSFSNRPGSSQSSLGLYVTQSTYEGEHGYSLRLAGLEPGINDQAKPRAIVLHGAWYVSKNMIAQYQRLGRSLGCPAVENSVVKPLIDTLKDGNLIFAYYPDKHWLSTSKFLNQAKQQ